MYCATRLSDGTVLRISRQPRDGRRRSLLGMLQPILAGADRGAGPLRPCCASRLSTPHRRAAQPSGPGSSAGQRMPMRSFRPSCGRINRQHKQITTQLRELQRRDRRIHPDHRQHAARGLSCWTTGAMSSASTRPRRRLFGAECKLRGAGFPRRRPQPRAGAGHRSRPWPTATASCAANAAAASGSLTSAASIRRAKSGGAVLLAFDITDQRAAPSRAAASSPPMSRTS